MSVKVKGDNNVSSEKMSFEEALDKAGFGLYSYLATALAGISIICAVCISYATMYVVPTSACDLETTVSEQGLLAAGPVAGLILGVLCWGYLSDTRGRRAMLLVSLIASSAVSLIATISVNWIMMLVLQFVASFLASGIHSMVMTLLSESIPQAKRNVVVLLVSSIFMMSQGLMALLAIPIIPLSFSHYLPALGIYWNSWRLLLLLYSIPGLITAVFMFCMQESPKFVYVKGDEARALKILRAIHRVNNLGSKEELQVKGLLKQESPAMLRAADQIVPLFKAPLLKNTIIMAVLYLIQQIAAFLVWLPTIADQFIRIIQTGEGSNLTMCGILNLDSAPADADTVPCALDQTSLLVVFGIGALQSISNIFVSLVVHKVGRRNLVIIITSVCGMCGILVNLVPNFIGSGVLFVIMLQGFVVFGLFTAFMVTLFPTHLRTMAMAVGSTSGRIGTVASVQILNALLVNNCDVGFYLFSVLFTACALVALLLPDDLRHQPSEPVSPGNEKLEQETRSERL